MNCRFCGTGVSEIFASLGSTPLANSFLKKEDLGRLEAAYPLTACVCGKCFLVQVDEFEKPKDIFNDYAYFSSYSDTWLMHCREYAERAVEKFSLKGSSLVVEIASNDGYLLQYFRERNIPVLGIEPAANVAKEAQKKGIPTEIVFFGEGVADGFAKAGKKADLLIANNVLAHVPALNDFVKGLKIMLKAGGAMTLEFPYLLNLIEKVQFDTIYHEHFSYFSLTTVDKVFQHHGLRIYDVEEIPTHGGSLRIYAKHAEAGEKSSERLRKMLADERSKGVEKMDFYSDFQKKISSIKNDTLLFLKRVKSSGKSIVGYGAPAKGNTFLNYCGIKDDLIDYTADRNPHKQGCFMPGSRIFIDSPEKIQATRPDYVFILPWNLKKEVSEQLSFIRKWQAKFVVAIPQLEVF